MLYKTKYEKVLEQITECKKSIKKLKRERNYKKYMIVGKQYESKLSQLLEEAERLKDIPEGSEIAEILTNNNFYMDLEQYKKVWTEKALKGEI